MGAAHCTEHANFGGNIRGG